MHRIKRKILYAAIISINCCILIGVIGFVVNTDGFLALLYLCFLIWVVFSKKIVFLKYFYFWFAVSWQIYSVYFVENHEMYMPNLKVNSYHTGALFPLILTNMIGFFILIFLEESSKIGHQMNSAHIIELRGENIAPKRKSNYKLIAFAIVGVSALFVLDISNKNYYISGAYDRFYYSLALNAISFSLYGYLMFLFPYLTINAERNGKKKTLWLFVGFYSIYILLIGQKFGPFLQIMCFLLLTYFIPFKESKLRKYYMRVLIIIGTLGLIAIVFSAWQMSMEKDSLYAGLAQLKNRIFNGQGDVWWGIYSKFKDSSPHINELSDEIAALFSDDVFQFDRNFGIYKMMHLIAPSSVVLYYAQRGARFTASTDASFYYYFGVTGMIVGKIILTFIMYFITNKIIEACKKGRGLDGVLYSWLMTHFLRIYFMSSFELFVCHSALLCYGVLIYERFMRKKVKLKASKTQGRQYG